MVTSFEGFFESYEVRGRDIELRFATGGFDPAPAEQPILFVLIRSAQDLPALKEVLENVRALDDYSYVEQVSSVEVMICADHEEPLRIRGEEVVLRPDCYGPRDFERLARMNHEWGLSQYSTLTKTLKKVSEVKSLVAEQARRVEIKLQGHPPGSTARVIYEQHLSFLERIHDVLKANP